MFLGTDTLILLLVFAPAKVNFMLTVQGDLQAGYVFEWVHSWNGPSWANFFSLLLKNNL